ncbi:MAG TPA: hypothetical protein VHT28_07790 [Silvibacterium sp.]|jgi:hypothetical protein|nr:hypothetical protein [Silvibacterium sp.]
MPARAAALCTRLLSTGKTCAQPALRGEPFCRFHNDARSRWLTEHDNRTFALSDELDAMTIPQLLETLLHKLSNIRSVVRTYPEAKLALIVAIDRLAGITSEGFQITRIPSTARSPAKSMTGPQLQQNQLPPIPSTRSMM